MLPSRPEHLRNVKCWHVKCSDHAGCSTDLWQERRTLIYKKKKVWNGHSPPVPVARPVLVEFQDGGETLLLPYVVFKIIVFFSIICVSFVAWCQETQITILSAIVVDVVVMGNGRDVPFAQPWWLDDAPKKIDIDPEKE